MKYSSFFLYRSFLNITGKQLKIPWKFEIRLFEYERNVLSALKHMKICLETIAFFPTKENQTM